MRACPCCGGRFGCLVRRENRRRKMRAQGLKAKAWKNRRKR